MEHLKRIERLLCGLALGNLSIGISNSMNAPHVGWISLLWLVLDQMVFPVCYALRISEIVTGVFFGYLYDVIFVCAPVFMIIFILYDRFGAKDRIRG